MIRTCSWDPSSTAMTYVIAQRTTCTLGEIWGGSVDVDGEVIREMARGNDLYSEIPMHAQLRAVIEGHLKPRRLPSRRPSPRRGTTPGTLLGQPADCPSRPRRPGGRRSNPASTRDWHHHHPRTRERLAAASIPGAVHRTVHDDPENTAVLEVRRSIPPNRPGRRHAGLRGRPSCASRPSPDACRACGRIGLHLAGPAPI
jgi:hypothetical protein